MLENSDEATSQIAKICGYPSLQYMYAVFKKHFDQTPKEYRDARRDKEEQDLSLKAS